MTDTIFLPQFSIEEDGGILFFKIKNNGIVAKEMVLGDSEYIDKLTIAMIIALLNNQNAKINHLKHKLQRERESRSKSLEKWDKEVNKTIEDLKEKVSIIESNPYSKHFKNRYKWKKTNGGRIYDRIKGIDFVGNKQTMDLMNELWKFAKYQQQDADDLKKHYKWLKRKSDYLDMLCYSYKDYYGEDIEDSQWFGFNTEEKNSWFDSE